MPKRDKPFSSIDNILFDLGGVLLNVDYSLTEKAFRALGLSDFDNLYSKARQSGLFDRFERGEISSHEFLLDLQSKIDNPPSLEEIEGAWNAMLLDLPENRLELIKSLRGPFGIYLLSNTNAIHFQGFNRIIEDQYKLDFSSLFNKAYYSHEIGKRKPDKEVFDYVFANSGLKKKNTLFIDDSIQHVEGARKAGYQALHLRDGDEIIALLIRNGILA